MVYMGLSLFIIRRALCLYGCMRIYAYNLTKVQMAVMLKVSWQIYFDSKIYRIKSFIKLCMFLFRSQKDSTRLNINCSKIR